MTSTPLTRTGPAQIAGCPTVEPSLTGTAFASGGEFTVGAEEELLLVDSRNRLVSGPTDGVIRAAAVGAAPAGAVTQELYTAEIEFATAVCRGGDDVARAIAHFRGSLRQAGGRGLAVGLHPAGRFGDAALTPSTRYQVIGDSLAGLLRTPTAAFQVHVGVPDTTTAIHAYRGLRHRLSLLIALSAGSPYWHGQDSGFASSRWALIKSYPRGGVPPRVRTWEEYVAVTEAVAAVAEVPDYTHVWWDLRVQPRLGTLEVRVMDSQPSIEVAAGLTTLVQGLARNAAERPADADLPSEVLAENDFRAARSGLDARLLDADGTLRPARELATRAVHTARDVLRADGLDGPLDALNHLLATEPEHARQRRVHERAGMRGVLADLSARTAAGR